MGGNVLTLSNLLIAACFLFVSISRHLHNEPLSCVESAPHYSLKAGPSGSFPFQLITEEKEEKGVEKSSWSLSATPECIPVAELLWCSDRSGIELHGYSASHLPLYLLNKRLLI